jgi:hypothetical protein
LIHESVKLSYSNRAGAWDGVLAELPVKLAGWVQFDYISIDEKPQARRTTVLFHYQGQEAFHVQVGLDAGRCLVEIGGSEKSTVTTVMKISRNHFDQWFGCSPQESEMEQKSIDRACI